MPDRVLAAIDALDAALQEFREAYEAWLGGKGDRAALSAALEAAEARLDAARAALDAMQARQRN